MATAPNNNTDAKKKSAPRVPRKRRAVAAPADGDATVSAPSPARIAAESAEIYPDTFDTPPSPDEIAAEAYAIYQERGGQHGRHEEDWLEAERRVSERRRQQQTKRG